jgi:hypothetical protein
MNHECHFVISRTARQQFSEHRSHRGAEQPIRSPVD